MRIKLPVITDELDRHGIKWSHKNAQEVAVLCPFHEDSEPSLHINKEEQHFTCRVCRTGGPFIKYLAKQLGKTQAVVEDELRRHYNIWADKSVFDIGLIEQWHNSIFEQEAEGLLDKLYYRQITMDTIRKHRIGVYNNRLTIPIRVPGGNVVQVRSYLPGAAGKDKMWNIKPPQRKEHRRKVWCYPMDQLQYEKLVITGGEMKALAAAQQLNEHNIGAVCATSGEGNWDPSLNRELKDKRVVIVMDVDTAGKNAANAICRLLYNDCDVWIAELPLDTEEHPKGDINDFIRLGGHMMTVIQSAQRWTPEIEVSRELEEAKCESYENVNKPKNFNKRLKFDAFVESCDPTRWTVPREVTIKCSRDQNVCALCPRYHVDEKYVFSIKPESRAFVSMCDSNDWAAGNALQAEIGVPKSCAAHEIIPLATTTVTYAWLSDNTENTSIASTQAPMSAYFVGESSGFREHASFSLEGTPTSHPKNQSAIVVASKAHKIGDTLSSFKMDENIDQKLRIFQPSEWTYEALSQKLDEIHKDISSNVTGIVGRNEMLTAVELSYFSPLYIMFSQGTRSRRVKGWVECLILGDSGQGKTEVAERYSEWIEHGTLLSCERVSGVGLTVAHDKSPHGSHMAKWGVLPKNDGGLVMLDELSRLNDDALSTMMTVRSSGVIKFAMAGVDAEKNARVRLVAFSNPKHGGAIKELLPVTDVIMNLMSEPAAIRRWDLVLCLINGEVSTEQIAESRKSLVEHVYDADLNKSLLYWAWTQKKPTEFSATAVEMIDDYVHKMDKWQISKCPIVSSDQSHKIARMAAALAARTFSTDDDWKVVVRPCHVEWVGEFMLRQYGRDTYRLEQTASVRVREAFDAKKMLEAINNVKLNRTYLADFLIDNRRFKLSEIVTQVVDESLVGVGSPREIVEFALGHLLRTRALVQKGNGYFTTAEFTQWLGEEENYKLFCDTQPDFGNEF